MDELKILRKSYNFYNRALMNSFNEYDYAKYRILSRKVYLMFRECFYKPVPNYPKGI